MKYHAGNIVILKNEKTVYIVSIDEKAKKYVVADTESNSNAWYIGEADILMLIT